MNEQALALETSARSSSGDSPPLLSTIGTAMRPSRYDDDWRLGHMWLFWNQWVPAPERSRGYYPDVTDVPAEHLTNTGLRRYFLTHRVPGRYMRDSTEMSAMADSPAADSIRHKTWEQPDASVARLEARCPIPLGETSVPEGQYSCNDEFVDSHNCCSWAVEVLNFASQHPLIQCDRPKRLSRVEEAIWGL